MSERGGGLWERVMELLFPSKCPFCGALMQEDENLICGPCQRNLPWLEGRDAERKVDFAQCCWSPLAYRGTVPQAVHRFKFGRVRAYAQPFGQLMAQCAEDHRGERLDCVTWAPLSRKRLKKRGFDQAELMAREVGKQLGLPVKPLVKKVRHNGQQSRLEGEAARRANALGAYELRPEAQVSGQRILLVDDVVTSGATLSECARLLSQNGAVVYGLTLAQARKRNG